MQETEQEIEIPEELLADKERIQAVNDIAMGNLSNDRAFEIKVLLEEGKIGPKSLSLKEEDDLLVFNQILNDLVSITDTDERSAKNVKQQIRKLGTLSVKAFDRIYEKALMARPTREEITEARDALVASYR